MLDQDEIIRMALKAGFSVEQWGDRTNHVVIYNFQDSETDVTKELERFAQLVEARKTEIAIAESYRCGYEAGASHEREKRTQELMQLFLDPENQPTQFGTATLEYREKEILIERGACAKVCDEIGALEALDGEEGSAAMVRVADKQAALCAAAIRARGDK